MQRIEILLTEGRVDFSRWVNSTFAALIAAVSKSSPRLADDLHNDPNIVISFSSPLGYSHGVPWRMSIGGDEEVIHALRSTWGNIDTRSIQIGSYRGEVIGIASRPVKPCAGRFMARSPIALRWRNNDFSIFGKEGFSDDDFDKMDERLRESTISRYMRVYGLSEPPEKVVMGFDRQYITRKLNQNIKHVIKAIAYKDGCIPAVFAPIYIYAEGGGSHRFLNFAQACGVGQSCKIGFGHIELASPVTVEVSY